MTAGIEMAAVHLSARFKQYNVYTCVSVKIFLYTQSVLWLLGFSVPMKDGTGSSGPGPEYFRTWALRGEGKP